MAPAGATGWSWAPSLQHKHQGPFRTEYVDSLGRIWLCHLPEPPYTHLANGDSNSTFFREPLCAVCSLMFLLSTGPGSEKPPT